MLSPYFTGKSRGSNRRAQGEPASGDPREPILALLPRQTARMMLLPTTRRGTGVGWDGISKQDAADVVTVSDVGVWPAAVQVPVNNAPAAITPMESTASAGALRCESEVTMIFLRFEP